jgi:sec-independent protein translocase protein TatA
MGTFSIWHWLIVLLVILLLFGGGSKLSGLMGDLAKGIKSFKKNMSDEEKDASMAADASPPPAPGTQPAGSIPGPTPGTTHAAGTTANTSRPAA